MANEFIAKNGLVSLSGIKSVSLSGQPDTLLIVDNQGNILNSSYTIATITGSVDTTLIANLTGNLQEQINNLDSIYATDASLVAVSGILYSLIASTSSAGISGGTTNHALLTNLTYDNSGHTGFASYTDLVTISGNLYSLIASTSGGSISGGTTNHALLSNLDYANANHTGFASDASLVTVSGSLYSTIAGVSGSLQNQIDNLDLTYATDASLVAVSGILYSLIASTSGDLQNQIATNYSSLVAVSGNLYSIITNSSGNYANLNSSNTFGNYLNTFTDSVNISGNLSVASVVGTNGNIVTHDTNGKLLDSGILATSLATTANLNAVSGSLYTTIAGVTGNLQNQINNLDLTYATDADLVATSGNLYTIIANASGACAKLNTSNTFGNYLNTFTDSVNISGNLTVASIIGTNGNIVTHDANGKLLDSGVLASSITSTSGTIYNILNDTYFTTGLLPSNLLNPAFDTTTKIFSLSASSGTIDFYIAGQKYQKSSPQTVDLTSIWSNNTLFFIYFNSSGVLSAMNTAWDINSNNAPVSTLFWNGSASASSPIIGKEFHNATRNLAWHKWAHGTIGTRYKSGLTGTFTSSSISTVAGVIEDEDLSISISPQTQARLLYRNNGGTAITYQDSISTISAVLSGGLLAYDNAQSSPVPVGTGNYVRNYIYASNDITTPLACIIGQNYYNNINDARNDSFPSQPTYISAETRLIYTVIWQDVAGVPTFIESTDFRTSPTQPNGSLAIRPVFLDEIQDVYAPTPTLDQVLRWNGTQWTNGSPASNSASNGIDFFGASPSIFNILSTPSVNQRGMSSYSKTPVISTILTPVTISIANPGLITYNGHNLPAGTAVVFSTTGALPTGLTAGTTYYVLSNAAYTANAFNVSATIGGTAINTTGTQSGTHTITTGTVAIQTATVATANTPAFLRAYLYNSALNRTIIDSGTWTFTLYGGVSSVGNGRVNTIYTNLYRVIEPIGILSISGSGTTRSVGISGATPFLSTDATSSLLSCSYLQTPTGFFEITGFTSSSLITITCLASYVNETNIAPTGWELWRFLFSAASPAVTSITPAIQTISYSVVQPSFSFNLEDKFGQIHLCSNTTNNSSTFTVYYNGSTSNSSTKTPLITLHNNLAGLQGGTADQYYHLNSSQYTIATQASTDSLNGYMSSSDHTTFTQNTSKINGLVAISGNWANLNTSNIFGNYLNTFTDSVNISGNLVVASIAGISGNIVTHDANGKLLDSGILVTSLATTSSLASVSGSLYTTIAGVSGNLQSQIDNLDSVYATDASLASVSGNLYSLIASTSGQSTSGSGTTNHALLTNLEYTNSGHTGFASETLVSTISGNLYSLIASTSGGSISGSYAQLNSSNVFGNYLNTFTNSVNISGNLTIASIIGTSGNIVTHDANGKLIDGGALAVNLTKRNITVVAGDGTSSLATGALKAYVRSPVNCNITQCTLLADVSGSIVIDIWKSPFSSFPPISGNSITDASKPTISGGISYQDSTLTNWTKTVSANDIFEFKIDSVSSIKKINIILDVTTI